MSKLTFPECLSFPGERPHYLRHQLDVQKLGQKLIEARNYPALIHLFKNLPGVVPHQFCAVIDHLAEQYDYENFASLSVAMREHAPQLRLGVKTQTLQKFLARALVARDTATYIKVISTVVQAYGGSGLVDGHISEAVSMVMDETDHIKRNAYLFDLVEATYGKKERPTCSVAMQTLERALQSRVINIRYIPDCGPNPYLRFVGPVLLAVDRGGPLLALQKQKTGAINEVVTQILQTDEIAAVKSPDDPRTYGVIVRALNAVKTGELLTDARKFVRHTVLFNFVAELSLRDARRTATAQIDAMYHPRTYNGPHPSRLVH